MSAFIVSKMTSHCVGTVHMREESESGIRKWEEMWFGTIADDGERGDSSDMRWKTVPQTSGCNRKRSDIRLHQLMRIYFNNPEKFLSDPIWSDGASDFLRQNTKQAVA